MSRPIGSTRPEGPLEPRKPSPPTSVGAGKGPGVGSLSQVTLEAASGALNLGEVPRTRKDLQVDSPAVPIKGLGDFTASAKPGKIRAFFEKLFGKSEPTWPEKVSIEAGEAGTFELDSSILPEMPGATTQEKNQLLAEVGQKIQRGYNLVEDLQKGDVKGPATRENIADILWYTQARSEQIAGSFDSGTTFLQDTEQNKILEFFDSVPESYQRISSHLMEFQANDVHRGIDFDEGSAKDTSVLLPHDKKTVLFFPLRKGAEGAVDKMPVDMIFLKMEEHGAAAYKPKGGDKSTGPKSRKVGIHDYWKALGHGFGYIRSKYRKITGQTSGANKRRERVPDKLKKEYKAMIAAFRRDGLNSMADMLEKGNPTKHGVRHMMLRIHEASKASRQGVVIMSDSVGTLLRMEKSIPKKYPHYDLRIGEEVIITADELKASL